MIENTYKSRALTLVRLISYGIVYLALETMDLLSVAGGACGGHVHLLQLPLVALVGCPLVVSQRFSAAILTLASTMVSGYLYLSLVPLKQSHTLSFESFPVESLPESGTKC